MKILIENEKQKEKLAKNAENLFLSFPALCNILSLQVLPNISKQHDHSSNRLWGYIFAINWNWWQETMERSVEKNGLI